MDNIVRKQQALHYGKSGENMPYAMAEIVKNIHYRQNCKKIYISFDMEKILKNIKKLSKSEPMLLRVKQPVVYFTLFTCNRIT